MADGTNDTIDTRDEQYELYVLGLLDEHEMAAVERLLREDHAARQRVRELREVLSSLALAVEPAEPSPALRARILDAARNDVVNATTPPPAAPVVLAERRERNRARWTPWLVAAALALALAASLVWNAQLRSDLDAEPETATYAVAGSGPAEGAAGTLIVVGDDAILNLAGLAALPADRAYQVWLIADGAPVPNVTFVPTAAGTATVSVPGEIADYRVLAITIEPLAGSAAPTTDPIITGDLT